MPRSSSSSGGSSKQSGRSKVRNNKRRQVQTACLPCRRAHAACNEDRPCHRCVKIGKPECCINHSEGTKPSSGSKSSSKSSSSKHRRSSKKRRSVTAPPKPLPPSNSGDAGSPAKSGGSGVGGLSAVPPMVKGYSVPSGLGASMHHFDGGSDHHHHHHHGSGDGYASYVDPDVEMSLESPRSLPSRMNRYDLPFCAYSPPRSKRVPISIGNSWPGVRVGNGRGNQAINLFDIEGPVAGYHLNSPPNGQYSPLHHLGWADSPLTTSPPNNAWSLSSSAPASTSSSTSSSMTASVHNHRKQQQQQQDHLFLPHHHSFPGGGAGVDASSRTSSFGLPPPTTTT